MDNYQRGVGLIEVLVALMIFAIGVVGMAGLQLRTLSMSMDSTQRSVVIAKSQDLADRIRSSGASPNDYIDTYDSAICANPPADICADTDSSNATACDSSQMVAFDVWDVFCANRSGLNGGIIQWTTVVSCTANCGGPGAQMAIATTWISKAADSNSDIADNTVTNADGSVDSAVTDRLTLSFVP